MSFDPSKPHNKLAALPPAVDLETTAVLKATIKARAALAELHATTQLIPQPAILINTIPLLEARASSEIEHIVTTADRLFRFAADERAAAADPATKEALRYRTALRHGFELLRASRPVSTNLAVEVCTILRGIRTNVRRAPGTALRNFNARTPVYTPPDGEERLRRLLTNWENFLHSEEHLDPLIRMAVGHYQFEAIHPFADGNGRTGRIMNLLFLIEQDLLELPVLYMSGVIIQRKNDYYRLLSEVTTQQRWEPWVLYILQVVHETSLWTTAKIRAIRSLLSQTIEQVRRDAPKIYTRELVDLLFAQPYCRIDNLVQAGVAKRQTASMYLATLVDMKVLEPVQAGREKLFIHRALLDLLLSNTKEAPRANRKAVGHRASGNDRKSIDAASDATSELNRSGSLDDKLRFAIGKKLLIRLRYSAKVRVVEPHDYGLQKGTAMLLAFQRGGSGDMHGRSVSGWRLFDVSKIEACTLLRETFPGSRGPLHEHHYVWDELYVRVE